MSLAYSNDDFRPIVSRASQRAISGAANVRATSSAATMRATSRAATMRATSREATARALSPRQNFAPEQPSLRLVISENINRSILGRASMKAVGLFIAAAIAITVLGLGLSIQIQQGQYQLAGLQKQMKDLTTTNQILDEQVRSLSSDQNLANAAASLGMVTNANPVYLRLSDGKIIGHPKVAGSGSGVKIGKNVVPNAALVAVTTSDALKASTAAALAASQAAKAAAAASASAALHPAQKVSETTSVSKTANVAAIKSAPAKVTLAESGIPVSPTN